MRPKHLFLLPHVAEMEPQPGGRWDVALAAERSAWRRANGLASGTPSNRTFNTWFDN